MRDSENSSASARLACAMLVGFLSCGWVSAASSSSPLSMATNVVLHGGGGVVAKTVISTKMRLVFIFGLEGTGHHYIMGASEGVFQANTDLPEIEKGFPGKQPYFLPFTMRDSAAAFDRARENARRDMRDLARREELIPSPTLHLLNGHSIPTGFGGQKVMQYSDPRLMAEAAEAEGIDFRVMYLKRSAKEILLANTVHREFQNNLSEPEGANQEKKFMEYVRILFTDVAVVQSFLAELDPAFVICHDWNLLGDHDQAQMIADAVAPNADVASLMIESLVDSASKGPRHNLNETHPFDNADVLSSRVQQKLDSFEKLYCGPETH